MDPEPRAAACDGAEPWHVPVALFVATSTLQWPVTHTPGLATVHEDAEAPSRPAPPQRSPAQQCCLRARDDGYDGIAIELANARWRERWERLCLLPDDDTSLAALPRSSSRATLTPSTAHAADAPGRLEAERWRAHPHFRRAELNLTRAADVHGVTAVLSQWLELDALHEGVRLDAELALRQEIAYAAYLGVSHVVLPAPSSDPARRMYLADYARAVRTALVGVAGSEPAASPTMRVSVRLPVSSPHILTSMLMQQATRSPGGTPAMPAAAYLRTNDNWAWETWETIQTLCHYHPQLHVALDLSMPLPPTTSMLRWSAEPVSLLWLPSTSFLANAKGYPVLSKSAQRLVRELLPRTPTVVLSDTTAPPAQHTRGGPRAYLQYVQHLVRTAPAPSKIEAFARGYADHLQAPLQPMAVDLGAATYDVFESDPVKYALYEDALFQALVQHARPGATTRVWVVGAGHGALVGRALAAAERASRVVHITALEKNAGACIAMQDRVLSEWGSDRVDVVHGDMRTLPVPDRVEDRADIVVSELLGSFADNELAPECLDGAMRFLKRTSLADPADGISIPSAYEPYITPIAAAKLHATIGQMQHAPQAPAGLGMGASVAQTTFDAPYVVLLQSANLLADDAQGMRPAVQPCWRFEHGPMSTSGLVYTPAGLPETNHHNVRTSSHTFSIPHAGVCHGLAGFFEAHLFGNVVLSIHPSRERASKDMTSWFPIFFPFREPLYLPANSELEVHLWRLSDERRVWYEWSAECFLVLDRPPTTAPPPPAPETPQPVPDTQTPAFSNAAHTPKMPSTSTFLAPPDASTSMDVGTPPDTSIPAAVPPARRTRIKTGQTALMNSGAAGSSLLIST
ncbi:type II protein arginine methyltransferase [Malassezia obtusa]|uniref:Type II protein arginine methyltransferase n=1 Tax=Malassezia obtusa TaxID=76774 RepID=A0AAF0IUM0_9BASI|nr:type II protein arginine methyltransferase [Malassezia obtusa]